MDLIDHDLLNMNSLTYRHKDLTCRRTTPPVRLPNTHVLPVKRIWDAQASFLPSMIRPHTLSPWKPLRD
jgi:hypothetical protein